jgi:hypothetical protein
MNDAIDTFLNSVKSLCPKVTEAELAYLESGAKNLVAFWFLS